MIGSAGDFYDELAEDYHLLFGDWSASIDQQGHVLDHLIRAELGPDDREVLDCACGIGTQAIGLARRGHHLVGSDLSRAAARRAALEAAARDLSIPTVAADMRQLPFPGSAFDVVVCADNAIAHLLNLVELATALREMNRVLHPGGLLIVSTRSDFARETHPTISPPQVHHTPAGPVITFQMWDWHPDGQHYDLQHIQLKPSGDSYVVRVRRATSWALTRAELTDAARDAGYRSLTWHDPEQTGFGQPILACRSI